MSGPPEAQLNHTLSKFHCLLHELYLKNHHSSQKHAIYGTYCLLLAFLGPTTCHISNRRSINLILSLYPLSCSLSSFLLCWGFVWATMAFPQHNPLKKRKKRTICHPVIGVFRNHPVGSRVVINFFQIPKFGIF